MNEPETRAELIDPKLKANGWGVVEGSKILRERDVCKITDGRIQIGGGRKKALFADYILVYKGIKLAVVEAKHEHLAVGEGVAQAKLYAEKLNLDYTYSTNGKAIYQICMKTGEEKLVDNFLTPDELWNAVYANQNQWRDKFAAIPFENKSGTWKLRYYQEIAINNALEAIAQNKNRILLTLATGTGKTAIAFQIAWKLFQTRWNLTATGSTYSKRQPRILFLADRNILADQAFNSFSAFPEDAMVRIKPQEVKKKGAVPTNGSIFFTIFQSFMAKNDNNVKPNKNELIDNSETYGSTDCNFGQYPKDFFDLIIIDECHRGGANDEGNWHGILEYFSPAVQLGLTATPKRRDNVNTYKYFGEPVYIYSLKEGINDGFLTPFKVKHIDTTIDKYTFDSDDEVIEGEIDPNKTYIEEDFNVTIEIKEREYKRVQIFMDGINQNEKTIVFCANQEHAALIRDLVNQYKDSRDPNYCVRVTADDGGLGEQFLREFQDNEKTIPTILTTSQKLSTGVDARNIRNIILMRPIKQIIEFKQIIGRGTRLFDGKEFFTIYDFVDASKQFADPEWDGEPIDNLCNICDENPCICEKTPSKPCLVCGKIICTCEKEPIKPCADCEQIPCVCKKKIKVKLADGKELEIKHITATSFWDANGKPISAQQFLENIFGEIPPLLGDEAKLREIWSKPNTRKALLDELGAAGFGTAELKTLQQLIDAENSDLFDVLEYVFNSDFKPITREERVARAKPVIFALLNDDSQKEFIKFVLSKYIEVGVTELAQEKLKTLLEIKYGSLEDAMNVLGDTDDISSLFVDFQKHLYDIKAA